MNARDIIWNYVHGQLTEQERRAFEQQMKQEPELKREVDDLRKLDHELDRLLPLAEKSDAELKDEIFQSLEKSLKKVPTIGSFAAAPATSHESALAWAWRRWFTGAGAFAVATAVVLIGLGVRERMAGPLRWYESGAVASAYRGDAGGRYRPEELGLFTTALRNALSKEFARAQAPTDYSLLRGARSPWRWDARVVPTADGALTAMVAIYARGEERPRQEWTEVYADSVALSSGIDALAARVIAEIK